MADQFIIDQHQSALTVDSKKSSKPMTRLITSKKDVINAGDQITYNKGASIIHMMKSIFGTEKFISALRNYLNRRYFYIVTFVLYSTYRYFKFHSFISAYKSATPDMLWEAIQEQVNPRDINLNASIATAMRSWTEQAGYPIISVKIESDKIKLRQDRFLIADENTVPSESKWYVPITLKTPRKTESNEKPIYWLSERTGVIERNNTGDKWILLNDKSSGISTLFTPKNSFVQKFTLFYS